MNKCIGCGVLTEKELCERCFRIKNYNDYKVVVENNDNFIKILNNVNETKDLVLLVVDLFNFHNLDLIKKYINNDILLVLTKRDLLPDIYEERIFNYDFNIDCVDKIIISSNKNYQFDLLFEKINKYKKSNNVYVVGYTNAGKSTMINKLIYNYSDNDCDITTSPLPNTTLNTIEVKLNDDLTLIDTPGLLDKGDIVNYLSGKELKTALPNKKIKPITYQIKGKQIIVIDKYAKLEVENMDITIYCSNNLNIKRYYKDNDLLKVYQKRVINVNSDDLVIKGLCFIRTNKKGTINVYTNDDVDVFTRKRI